MLLISKVDTPVGGIHTSIHVHVDSYPVFFYITKGLFRILDAFPLRWLYHVSSKYITKI